MKSIVAFILLISLDVAAQNIAYPQDYFRNPLNLPILLAGNFGECRPGHFHSGIDIKTEGRENQAVYAAAEGYISRIKMEPGGFGHGLYITHPNGYTTLYAHLNDFFPELQKLVRASQYEKKSWELDLTFSPDKFPVKKGQQIAWSGNTGGSSAPHLHFEIRDTKTEHPLNPMLFGFVIKDDIAPVVSSIALYDAAESLYEQQAQRIPVKKKGVLFAPEKDTVVFSGNTLYIGIAVNDYMNNSANTLSFYTTEWYADDSLQGRLILDDIGYEETRYLNACADYKTQKQTGTWFNSLFVLPNNRLNRIYTALNNINGSIVLAQNKSITIRIVVKDVAGNESIIQFVVLQKGEKKKQECTALWTAGVKNSYAQPNLRCVLEPLALYDNVCLKTAKKYQAGSVSSRWQLNDASVPVHQYFNLDIRPDRAVPFAVTDKMVLLYNDGKNTSGKAAKLLDGWYSAAVRNFGDYWLAVDTTAPVITPLAKSGQLLGSKKEIRFIVKDNLTSVKSFTGSINGQWVCFEQHGNNWFYHVDEYCPKGKNKLALKAVDENGNERNMDYYFTR